MGVGLAAAVSGAPPEPDDVDSDETTLGEETALGAVSMLGADGPITGVGDGAAIATGVGSWPQRAPNPLSVIAPSKMSTARW
jgi:hypothetical protein